MKKYLFFLIFPFFFACNNAEQEAKLTEQQALIDSLSTILDNKDQAVNEFFESFNTIQENLDLIKEKEGIITASSTDQELQPNAKEKINSDIVAIYELMQQNKQELAAMKSRIRSSNVRITEFEKMVENLNRQIQERDAQIEKMTANLEALDIIVEGLTDELDSMFAVSDNQVEVIEDQTQQLNTAYFIFGTKKELEDQQVITREGGFIGIGKMAKLMENFNKDNFTKIDIRKTTSIPVFSKTIEILTTHPASSYQKAGNATVDSLVIKDPAAFWSVSKYLVIITE